MIQRYIESIYDEGAAGGKYVNVVPLHNISPQGRKEEHRAILCVYACSWLGAKN